ncbi:MAG TPA: hypothetical protein VM580_03860, partial [Labilithrix sp.]|nr:hypothetical protein [Labilithrix sp.]
IPLGTVRLFHDAVYHSIETSRALLLAKFLVTGNLGKLRQIVKARITPSSLLVIPFHSTTPYALGPERAVKYGLFPTAAGLTNDPTAKNRSATYLTDDLEQRLADGKDATFHFCIQPRAKGMPIDDAAVLWDERVSPFVRVATLHIPSQTFRAKERDELGESLAFSPGNTLAEHAPLGGLNRARTIIYKALSDFRHDRDNRPAL